MGSLTGRGHPWVRGLICGAMTALGGIGHTLPFLLKDFRERCGLQARWWLVELGSLTWIRHRYMDSPGCLGGASGWLGGVLVFITGVADRELHDESSWQWQLAV